MKQTNDFLPRVSKLIEASIATKRNLLRSTETLSTKQSKRFRPAAIIATCHSAWPPFGAR